MIEVVAVCSFPTFVYFCRYSMYLILKKESKMGYAVDFDGQLYNGLSIGKAEAFASVFDRYHRLLYALAYRYLKSGPANTKTVTSIPVFSCSLSGRQKRKLSPV